MGVVEGGSSARVVCRDCASVIQEREPRFVREEGLGEAKRRRARHLACAAISCPGPLSQALELGGWAAVAEEDHDELRARMDDGRYAQGSRPSSTAARSLELEHEPSAGRSSSGMAAAAVLEPARAARRLRPDEERAWVYADHLQSLGDVRGELLALELAAEHTADPLRARALQAERARRAPTGTSRASSTASLEASPTLGLRFVGGFLIGARPQGIAEIGRLLAADEAASLTRVCLSFCTQDELAHLVGGVRAEARPLKVLDLPDSRVSDLSVLSEIPGLRRLRAGGRFRVETLALQPGLRALSLGGQQPLGDRLARCPELERLEFSPSSAGELAGLGEALPALKWLSVGKASSLEALELGAMPKLRVLRLPEAPLRALAGIGRLPALRELLLTPGSLRTLRELPGTLAAPRGLERLALLGSNVGELDPLVAFSSLRHLALSAARSDSLEPLRALPGLHSLRLQGGDLRRVVGLGRLTQLEQLGLVKLTNVDLGALHSLPRLHTLVLRPGGRRPQRLEVLGELTSLRRVSMPMSLFEVLERPAHVLAGVEVLELVGDGVPAREVLGRLPVLRRLLLPRRAETELAPLRAAAPGVAVFGQLPPRDRLDHRDLYDWRAGPWPGGERL